MARKKCKGTELSVLKGREAKLNRAIFHALGAMEPQSTRALHKRIIKIKGMKHTSYSTVNKRVRSLEQTYYVRKIGINERVGGITNYYELRPKACLAKFFDFTTIEELIEHANDETDLTIFVILLGAKETASENKNEN